MLERTETRFGIKPPYLAADSAYGSAESLAWLVKTQGDRATHSGLRQIQSNRWHVLPRRFRLRRRTRPLHLPRGQRTGSVPTDIRDSQKRRHSRGHKTISRQQIGLRCLQAQSPVLPERSRPQDPAGSGRRCSRRRPRARHNTAIRGGVSRLAGRRSRCCSLISSASLDIRASASGVRTARETSSCSRPPPRTSDASRV